MANFNLEVRTCCVCKLETKVINSMCDHAQTMVICADCCRNWALTIDEYDPNQDYVSDEYWGQNV